MKWLFPKKCAKDDEKIEEAQQLAEVLQKMAKELKEDKKPIPFPMRIHK